MGRRTGMAAAVAAALALSAPAAAEAKTLLVAKGSPSPGSLCAATGPGTYSELHQAVAAAAAGDTIYVCAAATPYAGATDVKQPDLRIVGLPDPLVPGVTLPVVEGATGLRVTGVGSSVHNLVIRAAPGTPATQGLVLSGDDTTATNVTVTGFGLGIVARDGASVERSVVRGTPTSIGGISVVGDNVRVSDTTVTGNGGYGIVADYQSTDAQIVGNRVTGNAISPPESTGAVDPRDCSDLSKGSGTSGTANTWSLNRGRTTKPSGICLPPCRDLGVVTSVVDALRPVTGPITRLTCL